MTNTKTQTRFFSLVDVFLGAWIFFFLNKGENVLRKE